MREMTPKVKRRLLLFFAGLSAGGALAVFAVARHHAAEPPLIPCGDCGNLPGRIPAAVAVDGHEKLGPPAPGEWRDVFHEPAQSFEAYLASDPNRKCPHRSTFYIQPFVTPAERRSFAPGAHEAFEKAIGVMREYAEIYFNLTAKILPAIPMFEETYHADRSQCDASAIVARLAERVPPDALVYIGLTEDDLYSKGLNFVFGVGSFTQRTGIYSLRRYQSKDEALFLRRSLNLMAHEVGHILSIHHCVTWRCVMQGANTLGEHDSHPMYLCPEDLKKLEWNCGFDRAERYRQLLDFTRKLGLKADADWIADRLK